MIRLRFLFILLLPLLGHAEGTRELAPNEMINVNGRITTDIAAIYIGSRDYGNFANFDDTESSTKLQVRILDPNTECLLLGFSDADSPIGFGNNFRFHVKDPNGQLVYSSDVVNQGSARIGEWQEAFNGPRALVGPFGYDQITISSAELIQNGWTTEGDYYIEFERTGFGSGAYYIPLWDITVADCSVNPMVGKKGRVWSEQWALFSPPPTSFDSNFDRPFNGSFYIVAPDPDDDGAAFVTLMDFDKSQFRGAAFSVALNSFGASNFGSISDNRKSRLDENSIVGEYPVFLNDPIDLFRTADLGELKILGSEGCLPDNFCFRAQSTESGEIELLLDFTGNNGIFDPNSRDVLLNFNVPVQDINAELCIPWNGLDGQGEIYQGNDLDSISVISSFRQGVYHFPVYDVEVNLIGFSLDAVRPAGLSPLLYYDDRDIPFSSQTGSPNSNLTGCEPPCHTWEGDVQGLSYGNLNTINSWWYARTLLDQKNVAIRFNKEFTQDVDFCANEPLVIADSLISQSGEYIFLFSSAQGCDSIVTVNAKAVNFLAAITTDSRTLNCYFPEITLSGLSSTPPNDISYLWTVPDSQNVESLSNPTIVINAPGTYSLTIEEVNLGCSETEMIVISEDFEEPVIEIIQVPRLNCYPINKEIVIQPVNQNVAYNINWTTDYGHILDNGDEFNTIIDQAGIYHVTLQNIMNGCSSKDSVAVTRDSSTYISIIGPEKLTTEFCQPFSLSISTNSTEFDSLRWTPGAVLSCDDCLTPTFLADQVYEFTVEVTDTNGCVAQHVIQTELTEFYKVYFPNAFSPNNDGINDVFKMYSAPCEIEVMEFSVYDRWGNLVFERFNFLSTDEDVGWEGKVKDNQVETGIYVYFAIIKTSNEELVQLNGNVHLIK